MILAVGLYAATLPGCALFGGRGLNNSPPPVEPAETPAASAKIDCRSPQDGPVETETSQAAAARVIVVTEPSATRSPEQQLPEYLKPVARVSPPPHSLIHSPP